MAIIKTVELPSGAIGNYNKIVKIDIYPDRKMVVLTVAVYSSEEARAAGKPLMWHEPVEVPFSDMTQNPLSPFYEILESYTFSPFKGGLPDAAAVADQTGNPNREVKLKEEATIDPQEPPPAEETE